MIYFIQRPDGGPIKKFFSDDGDFASVKREYVSPSMVKSPCSDKNTYICWS